MPGDQPTNNPEEQKRPIVLIAEDEAPIADALAMVVEEAGYTAVIARHGEEALKLARAQHPALLITDLMMPYLDGAKLIAALKEDAQRDGHPPIPIILMTAAGIWQVEHIDADALLLKPFEVEEIEDLLRRFLEQEDEAPGDEDTPHDDDTSKNEDDASSTD